MNGNCIDKEKIMREIIEMKMRIEEVQKDIDRLDYIRNTIVEYLITHTRNYYKG